MESIILHQTPLIEIQNFISETIKQELKNLIPTPQPTPEPNPDWLTRKQVANRLDITLVTVDKYTRSGILQGYRIGGRVKYKASEIGKAFQAIKNAKYQRG